MGQFKNIVIEAQDALLAVECKVAKQPFCVDGTVDEVRYTSGSLPSFLVGFAYEDGDETKRLNFMVVDNVVVEIEASEFGLMSHGSMDLSDMIPALLEAIA